MNITFLDLGFWVVVSYIVTIRFIAEESPNSYNEMTVETAGLG
jgi:hypothetical protein